MGEEVIMLYMDEIPNPRDPWDDFTDDDYMEMYGDSDD